MIIPVILGPTCIGKTSLALRIADEIKADILSIDSRQVYQELDIGTGKFKSNDEVKKYNGYWEINGIKIWGYDFLKLNEELNVLVYCNFAKKIIQEYQNQKKKLIITCGTGFYLNFLMGNIPFNEINQQRKEELNKKTLEELVEIFSVLDKKPEVDLKNKVRVITAILNLESNSTSQTFKLENVEFKIFRIDDSRENLYLEADKFVNDIVSKNVVLEYQDLHKKYGINRALTGLIYSEISEFVQNKITQEEMVNRMKFSLHAYIRRQLTYFNKMSVLISTKDRELIVTKIKELL